MHERLLQYIRSRPTLHVQFRKFDSLLPEHDDDTVNGEDAGEASVGHDCVTYRELTRQ